MDNKPMDGSAESAEGVEQKTRKPYTKPAFQYERVFETMALSCGKIGPGTFPCAGAPKAS